jgi:putative lipoic acid-binding regulatory protein
MDNVQAVDLLESTHTFPGPYTFKVIGRSERGFAARAIAAVREELEGEVDPPFRVRDTAGGRHTAVTLEPTVESAWQVIAVYQRLQMLSGLVLLW